MLSTNGTAEQVMLGNYTPSTYQASNVIIHPDSIIAGVQAEMEPDSIFSYLTKLSSFQNRNTGSDTVSSVRGIGAARRWAYSKFQQFSAGAENRLLPSYLQYDNTTCGVLTHRNVFAVLPGMDINDNSIIIVEAHMDSRCQTSCDTVCLAEGAEDNASGTALVLELARVMSKYSFDHTIVFMTTTGEEQGLAGADAFSAYCVQKSIDIKAVFNNDVVGGIICGATSSGPSCPGLNHIDSTQVRLFSQGTFNSRNKSLCRWIKLEYAEELYNIAPIKMMLTIMNAEDRVGRGGDHIPFRQDGFAAMRFCSANEHGNASAGPGYTDRQHTHNDILGLDTDTIPGLDSFFVDFNYLLRNAAINANSITMAGVGPEKVTYTATKYNGGLIINITDPLNYDHYRVGIRSSQHDFDTIFTFLNTKTDTIYPVGGTVFVTAASVDSNGVESFFSDEQFFTNVGFAEHPIPVSQGVELLQNVPNPFDESTALSVNVTARKLRYKRAYIMITDIQGKEIQRLPIQLEKGMNAVTYHHGYGQIGTYVYSLFIDGQMVSSRRMIFAN